MLIASCASGSLDAQEAAVIAKQAIETETAKTCGRPPAKVTLRRVHEDRYLGSDITFVFDFDVSFDGSHVYDTAVEVSKTWRGSKENAAEVQGGAYRCKDYM